MRLHADPERVRQVLLNLLTNAIKYNRDDGRVAVECAPADAGRIRVAITDTGHGIAPELVARAFEPFERLGAEFSEADGTGLGLALTKGMLQAMGGTIGVQSTPGTGTTFAFELDQAEPPTIAVAPPAERHSVAGEIHDHTVLLIEDNPSNLRLVAQILERRPSVELITATHGGAGIELASQRRPDLVLLDLNLPDFAGDEVLARLRDDESTAQLPVVVLTANAVPQQRARLLAAGAHAYLAKPIDVSKFLDVIDNVLLLPTR
jgi:CheY-like chemotaxis protein/anti-sigma regulatory factor (Ser/Thr protein kinase)